MNTNKEENKLAMRKTIQTHVNECNSEAAYTEGIGWLCSSCDNDEWNSYQEFIQKYTDTVVYIKPQTHIERI